MSDSPVLDVIEAPPPVSSARLIRTLALAGVLAGLLLVVVFDLTQPAIRRNKAEALARAVQQVLHAPARTDALFLIDGRLRGEAPEGVDPFTLEQVFLGYDESGAATGFAVSAGEPGFQDVIRLIFGYSPTDRRLLGMMVLESKETPGLGDKIEKDLAWVSLFEGALTPLVGVKPGRGSGVDEAEIDLITGATISSKAVVRIINHRIEELHPLLLAWLEERQ